MVMILGRDGSGGEGALRSECLRAWWLVSRRFWVLGGNVAVGVRAGA